MCKYLRAYVSRIKADWKVKMKTWFKKIAVAIVALFLMLLTIAFTFEQISRLVTTANLSPEGELIDVGGHHLHFVRHGSEALL